MDADEPKRAGVTPRIADPAEPTKQEQAMVTTASNRERKTAIVVGASRGLGLGLAREFARRGWQVTATARNASSAGELADTFAASDEKIEVEQVDINLPDSVDSLVTQMGDRRLDLVFINAGVAGPKHQSVDATTPQEIGALVYTNAVAPIRIARRLLPLLNDGGILAFMSSRMGSVAENLSGGIELYRASKAALNSLTRSFVATDIRDRPIAVLTMHPGWVRTDMGGPNAPLSVAESVAGIADIIEAEQAPGHRFVDYQGAELAW
jgi:NAD(P)-dependent dehydrogenase (short-subunit alcohol dehydrogenase family)